MTQNNFAELKSMIIKDLVKLTREKYVYPEVGEQIADKIQAKHQEGTYDQLDTEAALAAQLTSDLRALSNDGHWFVAYDPRQAAALIDPEEESDEERLACYLETVRKTNYGFKRVEQLNGNVGYLDLRSFIPSEHAGETAAAAMNFLANCDALIIDLRKNHGGFPSMVQLITSYLFDEKPRHINTFYYRPTDDTQQFWTFPHVPGKRSPDTPLYLLTSKATGSAAEEFCYNLKHMERATLIGETTAGVAHPVTSETAAGEFVVRVPYGRPINPVTGENWEVKGVSPHLPVPAEEALKTAHLKALENLIKNCENDQSRTLLEWQAEVAASEYHPFVLSEEQLAICAGNYGKVSFTIQDDSLVYKHQDIPFSWPILPLSATSFHLHGDLKFNFSIDESGKAVSVKTTYLDGRPERVLKRDN